ncbi:Olfactory Receptor 2Ag1 [Manis pentadactyla]|nr:Olfactory Receptor 2Ag1 [Manis pentadactyla]
MSYDRYVAVCKPLHYSTIMTHRVCVQLAIVSWISGAFVCSVDSAFTLCLPYQGQNVINHYFCEPPALLKLASADTYNAEMALFSMGVIILLAPVSLILVSYWQLKKQQRMEPWNSTLGSGFILMGILNDSGSPELLCAIISVLYMLALTSNGLLLLVITVDSRLHVPMYFLLGQLSFMDLLFTSVVTPKVLLDFLRDENTVSFWGCALQMFLALTLGGAEDLLLAFMAYDSFEHRDQKLCSHGMHHPDLGYP